MLRRGLPIRKENRAWDENKEIKRSRARVSKVFNMALVSENIVSTPVAQYKDLWWVLQGINPKSYLQRTNTPQISSLSNLAEAYKRSHAAFEITICA